MSDSIVEISGAPASEYLVSLAQAKGVLPSLSDSDLNDLIAQASAAIASYCSRSFGAVTATETFRLLNRADALVLSHYPVSSVAGIELDGVALTSTGYEVDKKSGLVYRLGGDYRIPWCGVKCVVTYTAGYELPASAPADLARACLMQMQTMAATVGTDPRLRSESVEGIGSRSWVDPGNGGGALPAVVTGIVDAYRDLRVLA
ncbi:hypothetical protein [Oceanibaculum indicum]|uniref:PhiE125 gp8 family phage protein n=1 Tax=Oceanibaculum indicum TaxID=526216 RepID=A0A420WGL4_9PROT|nr:hypothetical protein [Oceanibaculum indicum]RKQ70123.1 hypothetical protein BCL74_2063 [Oceanibaculum indicum]